MSPPGVCQLQPTTFAENAPFIMYCVRATQLERNIFYPQMRLEALKMAGNCLTLADRREIERLYAADEKPSVIAAAVGVSVATIYRELKRGETGGLNGNYCPAYSAETAEKAVRRSMRNRGRRKQADSGGEASA